MIKKPVYQRSLTIAGIVIALALLLAGSSRSLKVYDTDTEEFGILTFNRINERQLVIDTTFHGIARKGEKFYSTYDRSQARGKRPCPT